MEINKKQEDKKVVMAVSGRLDTTTAPDLEKEVATLGESVEDLVFDFSDLEYISSAGLRVLLNTVKKMSGRGTFKITGVSEVIMEVFDMTGFSSILDIEE